MRPSSTDTADDDIAKRRVPCVIAYLSPFRMVESDTLTPWEATIEQVNGRTWDYAALHEMAGGLEVGLPAPYHLVIARDGALALPPIPELRSDQAAVAYFNRCLAALLIGGVYCEAVTPDGLDLGSVIDWRYIRSQKSGSAAPNRFHEQIRYGAATPLEAVALYRPRTIAVSTLSQAMKVGLDVLSRIPAMRGEYLLRGVTGIARRDWGVALSNLWIVVEQVVAELWTREVVEPTLRADNSKARRDQLSDTRTWTASARIELLFQKGVLSPAVFQALSKARRARNDLAHQGRSPSDAEAYSAYDGVCGLLSLALSGEHPPLLSLAVRDHSLSDPFAPPQRLKGEPQFWMEIPKLPGELELEQEEARRRSAALGKGKKGESADL